MEVAHKFSCKWVIEICEAWSPRCQTFKTLKSDRRGKVDPPCNGRHYLKDWDDESNSSEGKDQKSLLKKSRHVKKELPGVTLSVSDVPVKLFSHCKVLFCQRKVIWIEITLSGPLMYFLGIHQKLL